MASVFSAEWAAQYQVAINANSAYRTSGARWEEGSIALVLEGEGSGRAVLLDLWHGECRDTRAISSEEAMQQATYVIVGTRNTWEQVLRGTLQPLMGLMSGKLKLAKGSLARLMPFATAASELVLSAGNVPTDFDL